MIMPDEINLTYVHAEIKTIFVHYEAALVSNDVEKLDRFFWQSELVVRFGVAENLYGIAAIRAFRNARNSSALARTLSNTVITSYGTNFATTTTEYIRENQPVGRQSQTWVKLPEGWRIVSAHVSLIQAHT